MIVAVVILLYGSWNGATLLFHLEGETPRTGALYTFAFGPMSLLTAALLLGPVAFGWTARGRQWGARLTAIVFGPWYWFLWPLVAATLLIQVFAIPPMMAGYALCVLELTQWVLWRLRRRWLRAAGRLGLTLRRLPCSPWAMRLGGAALFTAVFAWSWSWSSYVGGGRYFLSDTVSNLFQARILEQGALWLPAPPMPEFYRFHATICDGKWHSQYAPGHVLVMALFDGLGILRAQTPLAAGATIMLTVCLGGLLYREEGRRSGWRVGLLAGALLAASPFFVLQYSEGMNHTTATAWFLLFLYSYEMALGRNGPAHGRAASSRWAFYARWALYAGWFAGMLMITRPLTAACLVGAWASWDVIALAARFARKRAQRANEAPRRDARRLAAAWVWMAIGGGLLAGYLLYYNNDTNGAPLRFGYLTVNGPARERTLAAFVLGGHTPRIGLMQALNNLHTLGETYLFGWPVTSYLFLAFLMLVAPLRTLDARLLATALALSFGYLFYYNQDHYLGPRYLLEAAPLYALLTARGVEALARSASALSRRSVSCVHRSLYVLVFLLSASSFQFTCRRLQELSCHDAETSARVTGQLDRILKEPHSTVFLCAQGGDVAMLKNLEQPFEPRALVDRGDEENFRFMRAAPERHYWLMRGGEVRRLSPPGAGR